MQKRFIDELDATNEGMAWLRATAGPRGAERIDTFSGKGSGGVCSAWKGNELLAYFVVVRDILNWSIVVTHDLSEGPGVSARNQATSHSDSQFALPYEVKEYGSGFTMQIDTQCSNDACRALLARLGG